jgi:uroporphyrinogen-III synthase
MTERLLEDLQVLVTRPRQQSGDLVAALELQGAHAIVFPVIHIQPRATTEISNEHAALAKADITIFISQNAVEHGLRYASGKLAAIGPTTSAAIAAAGRIVDICPNAGFDSEHLLAEPEFADVAGKAIRIIRGDAGRELLADELRLRGASVDYLSTYERQLPDYDVAALQKLEQQWRDDGMDAIVVMSMQSLDNLGNLLPEWCQRALRNTPLVTPAARVLKKALDRYPGCPAILAAGPQVKDIVNAIAASQEPSSDQ